MKKLENTKNIHIGSLIRAYKKGFGYGRLTVIDNGDRYLGALCEGDFFKAVSEGDKIEMYLWVEEVASYEFTMDLIGRIITDPKVLFFSHTDRIERSEERRCLSATVDIPLKFFIFNPVEKEKGVHSEEVVFHNGKLVLLEDRAAALKCVTALKEGSYMKGHVTLGETGIEFVGKIISLNPDRQIYMVEFTGMHEKDRNTILEFIFSTYRE